MPFPTLTGLWKGCTGAILAAAFLIIGAFVIGYVLGGANFERHCALGLATAQRRITAAMVVAAESFENPDTAAASPPHQGIADERGRLPAQGGIR